MLSFDEDELADACDCAEFVWDETLASPGEETCMCGHSLDEHAPGGECLAGVLE